MRPETDTDVALVLRESEACVDRVDVAEEGAHVILDMKRRHIFGDSAIWFRSHILSRGDWVDVLVLGFPEEASQLFLNGENSIESILVTILNILGAESHYYFESNT